MERVRDLARAAADEGVPAQALAQVANAAADLRGVDPIAAALLLAEGAWYARRAHGPGRALELALEAVELGGDAIGEAALLLRGRLGDALQWNGRFAEAREQWLGAAAAEAQPRDPWAMCMRASCLLRSGELERARESAYACAERARSIDDVAPLYEALTFATIAEIHLGLLQEAQRTAETLETVRPGASVDRLDAIGLRSWAAALLGDEAACSTYAEQAAALARELRLTLRGSMSAGLIALSLGRYDDAVRSLRAKAADVHAVACAVSLRPFLAELVEACVYSGRDGEAARLVDDSFDAALGSGQARYRALAFRMRAVVRGDEGDYRAALAEHARWGNPFEEARTLLSFGETLRRARRRSEARELIERAMHAFVASGARLWASRAGHELRIAGARRPRDPAPGTLTAQEQRVAALVAQGLSNKEIAARLFLSTKTVEGHLRNVFSKLGVTSRTQLVVQLRESTQADTASGTS